jgi:hypothetical protein
MIENFKMGNFSIWKRTRKEVNTTNQNQGKAGETQTKTVWEWDGWKMTRTGRGHDYRATRKNPITGKTETKYVEVKTGNSKLSTLQRKKKKQLGSKYVVERIDPNFLIGYGNNAFENSNDNPFDFNNSIKKRKQKTSNKTNRKKIRKKSRKTKSSKTKNYGFNMNNVFGSGNDYAGGLY